MKEQTILQKWIRNLVDFIVILSLAWFVVHSFFSLARVSGHSMEPSLSAGDTVLVDEFFYQFKKPKRYDVVLFQKKDKSNNIKRIIGQIGRAHV